MERLTQLKNIIMPFQNNTLNGVSVLVLLSLLTYIRNKLKERTLNIKNQLAFITGGSEGSGLAVAKQFLKMGGSGVTIIARNMQKLEKAQQELEKVKINKDQKIVIFSADVTSVEQLEKAFKYSKEQHKKVADYYFMVAGLARPGYFMEQDLKVHQQHMDINYNGCLYTAKLAAKELIDAKQKGKLVFYSSAVTVCGMIGYTQYCPSKFALRGLCDSLRAELLPYGIDVHLYIPSNIDSPGHVIENQTKPPETREIEGQGSTFSCEEISEHMFKGIAQGQYTISNELLVELGRISSDGPVPTVNIFFDILVSPLIPLIRLFFTQFQNYVVKKYHRQREQQQKKLK